MRSKIKASFGKDPAVDLDGGRRRRAAVRGRLRGFPHCLDAATGEPQWEFDMLAAVWGSPLVADGKVYLGDEDADVVGLQAGKALKKLAEINMGSAVYSTPVPANGVLYIMNASQLFPITAAPPAGPRP